MSKMRPFITAPACLGTVLALFAFACSGSSGVEPDAGGGNGNDSDAAVGEEDFCGDEFVDCDVFQTEIMPSFASSNCIGAACHDTESAQQGFGLYDSPELDSDEMLANFNAVRSRMNLNDPENSNIYVRSIDSHLGQVLSEEDAAALLAWIEDAAEAAEEADVPTDVCADLDTFNQGVFADEIFPILDGYDLNTERYRGLACTGAVCHAPGGGSTNLILDPNADAEQNLENFSCFVNFSNPAQSQLLLCAQNLPGCRVYPNHPGGDFFENSNDLNYQRVIAYIYASADNSPLDLAFFAENIQPIFDDPDFSQDGTTCTNAACHGVAFPGDTPGNGSNFPILQNVSLNDLPSLTTNFTNAASFTNYLDPENSSLVLFPTNQNAHLGGAAIDRDDPDQLDFLENVLELWIGGLRPDALGFNRHWLLAGPYAISDIGDPTPINETEGTPRYREDSGSVGTDPSRWREEFSADQDIDLDAKFPGLNGPRGAYAVAYVLNEDSRAIDVQLEVQSASDIHVYFGNADQRVTNGNGAIVNQTIPPFSGADGDLTRILIKVFEEDGQAPFEFTARFLDDDDEPLTDETGELVIVLGPEGGV